MSNKKTQPLKIEGFFSKSIVELDEEEKDKRLNQTVEDIYSNASFKDGNMSAIPSSRGMQDGETRNAKTGDGTARLYKKIDGILYYVNLTKA